MQFHPRERRSQSQPKRPRTQQRKLPSHKHWNRKTNHNQKPNGNPNKTYDKRNLHPYISNEYRKGDIRHCYADTTKAQKLLNLKPTITLQEGLTELASWAKTHGWEAADRFEKALEELKEKHLA